MRLGVAMRAHPALGDVGELARPCRASTSPPVPNVHGCGGCGGGLIEKAAVLSRSLGAPAPCRINERPLHRVPRRPKPTSFPRQQANHFPAEHGFAGLAHRSMEGVAWNKLGRCDEAEPSSRPSPVDTTKRRPSGVISEPSVTTSALAEC
jgi:hypothetical protein